MISRAAPSSVGSLPSGVKQRGVSPAALHLTLLSIVAFDRVREQTQAALRLAHIVGRFGDGITT